MVSVIFPLIYVSVLVGAMVIFSRSYRSHKLKKLSQIELWYSSSPARDIYYGVKQLRQDGQKIPDKVLRASLLNRAAEAVSRLMSMREAKVALTQLHSRNSVGDSLWTRFLANEKLVEAELNSVAQEANELKPGWHEVIFVSASEIVLNSRVRKILDKIPEEHKAAA